ncbi:hypothetical protein EBT31_15320 [bacterium]|nr:hypothetical protein [bacterium]
MAINASAVLVELNISVWPASKVDKEATEKTNSDAGAVRDAAQTRKNLFAGTSLRKDIEKFAARVRLYHNQHTLPWADKGERLLPTSLFMDYKRFINEAEFRFGELCDNFFASYPQLLADAPLHLGKLYKADDYPDIDEVKRRFGFRYVFSPLPEAGDFRLDVGNEELQELKQKYAQDYDIRLAEAHQSKTYWAKYFADLGQSDTIRRSHNPVSAALDAGSFFLYGILLRWVLMHKMSPAHGYLHVTTGYPSLVYELMEPYRYVIEDALAKCFRLESKDLTEASLSEIKASLDEVVYAPSHRTHVRRKNLLHGAVLSMRSYLLGETKRLVLPTEGQKMGGRPPKMSYQLPGANAKVKVVPG